MNIWLRIWTGLSALACAPLLAQTAAALPARPPLVSKAMTGAPVDLLHLRGQVVLVFFWSTHCPVCLDKLPELRRNLEGWRGKEFVIVAVSQDRSLEDLRNYEALLNRTVAPNPQMKIVWRNDPAHRDGFGAMPTNSPSSFILDRTGKVAKQHRGRMPPELWDDIAELVLN